MYSGSPDVYYSREFVGTLTMPLSAILPGRVPNSLLGQRLTQGAQLAQSSIQRLQDQLSSGQKFRLPSQAPVQAIQTLALQRVLEQRAGLQYNQTVNQGFLTATDQGLTGVVDALQRANAIVTAGIGQNTTAEEKTALANEVSALRQAVMNAANTEYNGRFLFGGSQSTAAPFEYAAGSVVQYRGDGQQLQTFADFNLLIASSVDGVTAFQPYAAPVNAPVNPVLTMQTQLSQLNDGAGVQSGLIDVRVSDGATTVQRAVDLRGAETLGEVKTRIENAFAAAPITVTVAIDPGSQTALQLTPSSGTISVADQQGGITARGLGIVSGPVATLTGMTRVSELTLQTPLASLNGGTGIGATAGTGLQIVNGVTTSVVDLDGAVTVDDLFNRIKAADSNLQTSISADGSRLEIVSRLSGARFSIGENGGDNATLLGIRTLTGNTRLADLNNGFGVEFNNEGQLAIQRRNGTDITVDLTGSATVQDVLDRINAVDPGNLVASLNSVGNGISLTDNSGTNPLTVESSILAEDLGLSGTNADGPTGVLTGDDVNPQLSEGVFSLLQQLEQALRTGDNRELGRLGPLIETETNRVILLRGEIGSRQQILDQVTTRMLDADVETQATLTDIFHVDLTEVITQLLYEQQLLQGSLQVSAQALQLSVLNYL